MTSEHSHEVVEETTPSIRVDRPRRFGRYTLMQKIAHGGMATLYLGRLDGPEGFEKLLAIKKIHPHLAEERQFVQMFLDEARFAARIQHPNVVQIFELGEVKGEYFFAMEYLEGESLVVIMRALAEASGPPPFALLAHVVARAADGLHAAHELRGPDGQPLGLVHRDVSPQNVLVTYDGLVKVVDFGIAKAAGRLAHTATGELKGKYAYMAPEQVLGRQVDRRADIFSLGVVLYEATTLRRLFKSDNELLTLDKITRHEVPPPSDQMAGYPEALEQVVLAALAKDPEERLGTAAEMAARLDAFVNADRERTSSATVGAWMRERFPHQIDEKRRMLEMARTLQPVRPREQPARSRRFPTWAYAVVATGLALAATVGGLHLLARPTEAMAGTVRVTSTPVDGEVWLAGRGKVGRAPLEIVDLPLGRHVLTVVAEGFRPRETAVFVQRKGQLVTVLVPLEPEEPAAGVLEVPAPSGLQLAVDGLLQEGRTPMRVELPVGEHTVRLLGEGLAPYEQRVTIDRGRTVVLAPPPVERPANGASEEDAPDSTDSEAGKAPRYGYLNLAATPWAEVYLGGRKLGTTPLVMTKLPAGRRRLKLVPEGSGRPTTITVLIRANDTTRHSVRL